jgi:hypothetical protein
LSTVFFKKSAAYLRLESMCPFSRSSLFQNLVDVQSCVGAKELLVTSEFGFARECDIEQVFEVLVAEIFDGDRATVWDDMVSHVLRISYAAVVD